MHTVTPHTHGDHMHACIHTQMVNTHTHTQSFQIRVKVSNKAWVTDMRRSEELSEMKRILVWAPEKQSCPRGGGRTLWGRLRVLPTMASLWPPPCFTSLHLSLFSFLPVSIFTVFSKPANSQWLPHCKTSQWVACFSLTKDDGVFQWLTHWGCRGNMDERGNQRLWTLSVLRGSVNGFEMSPIPHLSEIIFF